MKLLVLLEELFKHFAGVAPEPLMPCLTPSWKTVSEVISSHVGWQMIYLYRCHSVCSQPHFFLVGFKGETQVSAHEEATSVYWWGWTGTSGLPAGQLELDGSLLVQVCILVST